MHMKIKKLDMDQKTYNLVLEFNKNLHKQTINQETIASTKVFNCSFFTKTILEVL